MSKKKNKNKKNVKKNNVRNNVVKKEVHKKEEKNIEVKGKIDPEITKLIKTVLVIFLIIGGVFLVTVLMNNAGVFDARYVRPERGEAVINYEVAMVGTIFNREDKEYYVVFDEFTEEADQYLYSILYRYTALEDAKPIYSVDMSSGFNESYKGEGSNPSAQKSEDVKINGPTLMKVKNGKNVKYIEGVENIEKELLK